MNNNGAKPRSICILPRLEGLGGPASFRARLTTGLAKRGIQTHQNPDDPTCQAVLLIGGTKHVDELLRARQRGLRLVQRLNGMNWLHKRRHTGLKHYLKSEWNNFILAFTRRWLADRVVYQSAFARTWWQTVYGAVKAPGRVIFNGVDLEQFRPEEADTRPASRERVLLVEGRLGGGYEIGLENAVGLVQRLALLRPKPVELMVVGEVADSLRERCERAAPGLSAAPSLLRWKGVVKRDEIAAIDRSAHLLFSADLNAACPNSVVEALACGLPVIAFATGSLPELLVGDSGRVVPWGGNYWKLAPPDLDGLASSAADMLSDLPRFQSGARARALEAFGLETMVDLYLDALLG